MQKTQKPFAIPYSMYHIINHTELCECSLTVAYEYQINKATLQYSTDEQPSDNFITYFAHNQAILDILKHAHGIDISNQIGKQIGMLTEDIPQFNLPELKWFRFSEDDVPHVYNNVSNVVDVELTEFLHDVVQGIDDYVYTNIAEWTIAQCQFWTYMHDTKWWQKVQFVASILGALCWIVAILICCCYKCMIIVTILGSQKLEEFDLIKTMPMKAHAAPTLPPNVDPILTLFPPEADHKDAPMSPQQIMSTFSVLIMVVLILALVIVFLWKHFCFASNVLRTCFPWFPYFTYHCGIAKADIFVEVTRVNGVKSTWGHFMQVCCHPTLLRRTGQLNSVDIPIVKHCCTTVIQINWQNILIWDHMNTALRLPNLGWVSCWSSSDLFKINSAEQYQIHILGRVLDQIYDILLDNTLPNPQHHQIGSVVGVEAAPLGFNEF